MTICPIAIVAGCRKCPAFTICPLKTVLGDAATADSDAPPKSPAKPEPRDKEAASRKK